MQPEFRPALVCRRKDGSGSIFLVEDSTNKDIAGALASAKKAGVVCSTLKALVREELKSFTPDELPEWPHRTEQDCKKWLELWWHDVTIHELPRGEAIAQALAFAVEQDRGKW